VAVFISASNSASAMGAERPLRNPYWELFRIALDSRYRIRRLLSIFSRILLNLLRRKIGRYESGRDGFLSGLKIGMTISDFQDVRKDEEWKMRLSKEVRWVTAFLWRFCKKRL